MATKTKDHITIPVSGMRCASRVSRAEGSLEKLRGGELERLQLDSHLHTCVIEGVRDGRDDQVIGELLVPYALANK